MNWRSWPFVRRSTYEALAVRIGGLSADSLRQKALVEAARGETEAYRQQVASLKDEIGYLRTQNGNLVEQLTRMGRVERGMTETPRDPRAALQPAPPEILEYWSSFSDPRTRKRLRDEAYRAHARGKPWDEIVVDALGELEPEEIES